jgi:L-ascorbate metabolism protein UlaG (beta-lactamase superfamily)
MSERSLLVTYVGGPTVLLEFAGFRLLTDPTFDLAGATYQNGPVTLRKIAGPAVTFDSLAPIDYVLLSHDHHFDNLDRSGRAALRSAKGVLTTVEGAERLGLNSRGLAPWEAVELTKSNGESLRVIATPARHGPEGLDRGAVSGFVFFRANEPQRAVYVSGDTVWYEGAAEVGRRYPLRAAILHLGAARAPEVGPFHLTMTAREGVEAARAFSSAAIVPVHFEGWAHFSEGRTEIAREFGNANLSHRLRWPEAGHAIRIDLS